MGVDPGFARQVMLIFPLNLLLFLSLVASSPALAASPDPENIGEAAREQAPSELLGADLDVDSMFAVEGYLDDTDFFVKYRIGEEILYSGGNWRGRVALIDSSQRAGDVISVPSLLPLEYHQSESWADLPAAARRLRILGVERWREFRDRLLASILPSGM